MSREHIPLFFRIRADSLASSALYIPYFNIIGFTFYHGFGRFIFLLFPKFLGGKIIIILSTLSSIFEGFPNLWPFSPANQDVP